MKRAWDQSRLPAVVHVLREAQDAVELDALALPRREAARPVPEDLVGGCRDDAEVGAADLVVERGQRDIQPATGEAPGAEPVADRVVPGELGADLVHTPVDLHAVLGRWRTEGPLAAHLDADRAAVRDARAGAPVPGHVVGPAAAAVIEHGPRLAFGQRMLDAVDREGSGCGSRDILDRVLEAGVAPRHDDGEALVALWLGGNDVEGCTVDAGAEACAALHLVNLDLQA